MSGSIERSGRFSGREIRTNILPIVLVLFVISLIITLNVFFQQSYQGEMAEQFNRQQLLIAKSVAKSIEGDMQHLEAETLTLSSLLSERSLDGRDLETFVDTAYFTVKEDLDVDIKILDSGGRLKFSYFGESMGAREPELFQLGAGTAPGTVRFVDLLAKERKVILVTPIMRGARLQGVLIVELMIDSINKKFLAPIRAGIRGHAWMMDGHGTLLFHPTQPKMVGKNLHEADASCFKCHTSFDVEEKILGSGEIGFSSYIAPYGEDKLIAFSKAKVADMSWIVCVSIPYSEVTFSIRKSMRLHSLLVISIFIATVVGAFAIVLMNRKRVKAEEKTKHLELQRTLEKEIIQTKDYLENLLESTESKILVLDRNLTVRTANSAQERLCGLKREDLVGRDFFEVFPVAGGREKEMIRAHLEECLGGSSRRISSYAFRRGVETLFLNININPLILHGEVSGIILSSSDITEEVSLKEVLRDYAARLEELVKERTDELLSEKEKLNTIVETIEAGLFLADSDRRVTWINKTLKEWLGVETLEGVDLDALYGSNDVQRAIVGDRIVQEVIHHDFGRRKGYFQVTSTPLVAPDGNRQTLVLVQDITDMRKMEEQMMRSEKLSALARISAGVAHEIGNPLTSISSYVQILREMEHDPFTKESLDTIARHIARITDIVRQMSSFSRTRDAVLRHHEVQDLVRQTLDLVRYDKRMKHIIVKVAVPDGLPRVVVDETQCIQVFMNIVLNAADAMASEGRLDIEARRIDGEVEVSFADSGPGIPPEHVERIFDPFFTTKDKGTGLGLAVSYNIIKSHQGDVLVENRPEGGSIFRVRLPYYES